MATKKLKTDRPTHTSDFIPADVERAVFLGHPAIDNLTTSLFALGTEVWSTRRRVKVLEAVLEEKGVTNEMIEAYMPTEEQEADWEKDRDRFVEMTYSPLLREGDLPFAAPFQRENK